MSQQSAARLPSASIADSSSLTYFIAIFSSCNMFETMTTMMMNSTQPRRENRLLNNVFIIICRTFTCSLHLINTNNSCVMQCNTDIGRPRQNCNIINVISLRFGICLTGDFKMGSSTRGYNSHTSPLSLMNIIYIALFISLLNSIIIITIIISIFIHFISFIFTFPLILLYPKSNTLMFSIIFIQIFIIISSSTFSTIFFIV